LEREVPSIGVRQMLEYVCIISSAGEKVVAKIVMNLITVRNKRKRKQSRECFIL